MACGKIEYLPDEMLMELFRYLPLSDIGACARVCQRWHSLIDSEIFWTRRHSKIEGENCLEEIFDLTEVVHIFNSLSLKLSESSSVSFTKCKIDISLSQQMWTGREDGLWKVARHLALNLTELTISSCITDSRGCWSLRQVVETVPFRNLRSFYAYPHCSEILDDFLLYVLCDGCPMLDTLVLEMCYPHRVTDRWGLLQLSRLKKLHTLHVGHTLCSEELKIMRLVDERRLRDPYSMLWCTSSTGSLSSLVYCEGLTSLYLSPCCELTVPLPSLKKLTLRCDDICAKSSHLGNTLHNLPALEELSLIGQWEITDDSVQRIRNIAPVSFLYKSEQPGPGQLCLQLKFDRH